MTYNLTAVFDGNNLYEIGKAMNDLTGGLYFTLIMLILLITYMAVFKREKFKEVFVAGSFFIVIIAVIMRAMSFVNDTFLIAPIIMFFASLLVYYFVEG